MQSKCSPSPCPQEGKKLVPSFIRSLLYALVGSRWWVPSVMVRRWVFIFLSQALFAPRLSCSSLPTYDAFQHHLLLAFYWNGGILCNDGLYRTVIQASRYKWERFVSYMITTSNLGHRFNSMFINIFLQVTQRIYNNIEC